MARRLTGKHASLYWNGVKVGDAYNCEVNIDVSMTNARAWGDMWKQNEPDEGEWQLTAEKFCISTNTGQFLKLASQTIDAGEADTPITVILYRVEGDPSTRIFEGPGWVTNGKLSVPVGHMSENLTVTGADKPTFVAGYTPL